MSAYATGPKDPKSTEAASRLSLPMTRFEARCILSIINHPDVSRSQARMGLMLLEERLRDQLEQ